MVWIIQNQVKSIVEISDLGIILHPGQTRDLDIIGRESAEKSRCIRHALSAGLIIELKKDSLSSPTIDSKSIEDMRKTTEDSKNATQEVKEVMLKHQETIKEQNEVVKKFSYAIAKIQEFAERFPEEMKAIHESMKNIKVEQAGVSKQIEELKDSGMSQGEIETQEKILKKRSEKLQKNYNTLGTSITANSTDIDDTLQELENLGIP
jgi:chromosome segregation ATPase